MARRVTHLCIGTKTSSRIFHTMPLNLNSIYPATDPEFQSFPSRRSVVHSTEGIIACTQPLAARCGLKVLDAGGNAAVSFSFPHLPTTIY
jgi:hypothetical protein